MIRTTVMLSTLCLVSCAETSPIQPAASSKSHFAGAVYKGSSLLLDPVRRAPMLIGCLCKALRDSFLSSPFVKTQSNGRGSFVRANTKQWNL